MLRQRARRLQEESRSGRGDSGTTRSPGQYSDRLQSWFDGFVEQSDSRSPTGKASYYRFSLYTRLCVQG